MVPLRDSEESPHEESGVTSKTYREGKFLAVDLRGRPADKSKTGGFRAAKFVYSLIVADNALYASVSINFVLFLIFTYNQPVATAATITTNFTATCFLLTVLGGFSADTFLGHYYAAVLGAVIELLGMGLLVLCAAYSGLQPPACTPTLTTHCAPAKAKYMAPLFVAVYTIALGAGFLKSGLPALGAEQFDDTNAAEKKQSVHYFAWLYFFQNAGVLAAFTLSVYLLDYVSKGWGFGWLLILIAVALITFLIGTPQYRQKVPGGSFITRMVQVWVAAILKRNLTLPADDNKLYDAPISGCWLAKSNKLRFLDKASIIESDNSTSNRWRIAGVTQVEEAKRILKLIPVWLSTAFIYIIFSQVITFTVVQGSTLDRSLGKHFSVPPSSLGTALTIMSMISVPIYDFLVVPFLRRITRNPYGLTPLQRMGVGSFFAIITMISGALVERKRLHYIRELGFTQLPSFEVPMSMWWLVPPYFFAAMTELFLVVAQYEFFYHEVSNATRSIGTSFLWSALALGYFMSSVIVNITNDVTRHKHGGAWLGAGLNNGGLENFYWVLTTLMTLNFVCFLVAAFFYEYNYSRFVAEDTSDKELLDQGSNMQSAD